MSPGALAEVALYAGASLEAAAELAVQQLPAERRGEGAREIETSAPTLRERRKAA